MNSAKKMIGFVGLMILALSLVGCPNSDNNSNKDDYGLPSDDKELMIDESEPAPIEEPTSSESTPEQN